jgi:hypothetical protein
VCGLQVSEKTAPTPDAYVIAGRDASPVFEPGKAVFDLVAFLVAHLVVWDRNLAPLSRRDTWRNSFFFKGFAIPIRIVPAIRQQMLSGRQSIQHRPCADVIAALTSRQKHP